MKKTGWKQVARRLSERAHFTASASDLNALRAAREAVRLALCRPT